MVASVCALELTTGVRCSLGGNPAPSRTAELGCYRSALAPVSPKTDCLGPARLRAASRPHGAVPVADKDQQEFLCGDETEAYGPWYHVLSPEPMWLLWNRSSLVEIFRVAALRPLQRNHG